MRRLRVAALVVGAGILPAVAAAGTVGSPAGATERDPGVVVTVEVEGGGSSGGGGDGGQPTGGGEIISVPCIGEPYAMDFFRSDELYGGERFSSMEDPASFPEGTEQLWQYDCYEGCPSGWSASEILTNGCSTWIVIGGSPPAVTVDDLWPGAYDEALNRIPLPEVRVAPGVVQGTLVNAPLWLAVAPPDPVSARAEVGAVWAQVDATFVGLTWNMGVPGTDDDVVGCDGPGEEWSEPGPNEDPWQVPPCGWNYDQPSTPEHTGNGENWYDITVTAHWAVRLTGSDGRDVALDPIDVALEFDYVVWELQTVGSG